jgi:hypothetical protein
LNLQYLPETTDAATWGRDIEMTKNADRDAYDFWTSGWRVLARGLAALTFGFTITGLRTAAAAEVPSLCSADEQTIWSCAAKHKIYSICASESLDATTGWLQYRAGPAGNINFRYPETLSHPKGAFRFSLLARGAQMEFRNGVFSYTIYEDITGGATIAVEKNDVEIASINCKEATDTLANTETINFMRAIGLIEAQ